MIVEIARVLELYVHIRALLTHSYGMNGAHGCKLTRVVWGGHLEQRSSGHLAPLPE
jgi:hypothetical protein